MSQRRNEALWLLLFVIPEGNLLFSLYTIGAKVLKLPVRATCLTLRRMFQNAGFECSGLQYAGLARQRRSRRLELRPELRCSNSRDIERKQSAGERPCSTCQVGVFALFRHCGHGKQIVGKSHGRARDRPEVRSGQESPRSVRMGRGRMERWMSSDRCFRTSNH